MRRREFSPRAVWGIIILWIIFCWAILWWGTSFAHPTPEDDARLEAAAANILAAYNTVQDIRQEGGQVPPPPTADKQDWQCYLDRYDDVRRAGPYTHAWASRHYSNWGQKERRTWGCTQVADPRPPAGQSAPILWKPVSESRGGRLVLLLPAEWPRPGSVQVNGEDCGYVDVEGANGGRHHYWCAKPGAAYPRDTVLTAMGKRYAVPDPGQRYESLREIPAAATVKRFHHYNARAWHGRGVAVILCPGDKAAAASIAGNALVLHGNQDKGRDVWSDYFNAGQVGDLDLVIGGQLYRTRITDASGMTQGDCWRD